MGIILAKNLKQRHSVKLTPSLKKSIDLLQLSRFELIKRIEKEMDENPFLENDENSYETYSSYDKDCLLYTSPSPRDGLLSRMPSSA